MSEEAREEKDIQNLFGVRMYAQAPWHDEVQIAIYANESGMIKSPGKKYAAVQVVMQERKEGEMTPVPIRMDRGAAVAFMDSLWQAGIRPSTEVASAGQLEEAHAHLKTKDEHIRDLRRMLFPDEGKATGSGE